MKIENAKIYSILNTVDDSVYIGSTCLSLKQRLNAHKSLCKRKPNIMPLYSKMFEYGINNFYIVLVEDCLCSNVNELREKEGAYIKQLGTLNKNIAGRDIKQYKEDNKEKLKEYNKQYRDNNKDYYKQYLLKYNKDNKDKIKQLYKIKINCSCGSNIYKYNYKIHCQSAKHKHYINMGDDTI